MLTDSIFCEMHCRFSIQNISENKLLSEVVESPVLKRKLDFILEFVVKKFEEY